MKKIISALLAVLMLAGALSVAASILMYIKGHGRNRGCLALSAGYLIIALFELGHYMHERYLVPALLLILVAFVYYRDRRLFVSGCI